MRISRLLTPLVVSVLSLGLAASVALAKPVVEARGIRIVGDGYGDDGSLRPFNWSEGTSVALLLTRPEGGLIEVERDQSAIKEFLDDKGKDLLKSEEQNSFSSSGIEMMPSISSDGTGCLFEVKAPGKPTKGANSLKIGGEVAVRVATKTEEIKAPKVALKIGEKFAVGPVTFEVTSIGKPQWGDEYNFALSLQTTDDVGALKELTFTDAKGVPVKASRMGTSSWGGFDKTTVTWEYHLKDPGDQVAISAQRWTDMQLVKIPFTLQAGLGL